MITLRLDETADVFYATPESAGFDLRSTEDLDIPSGEWRLVDTGLRIVETAGVQECSWFTKAGPLLRVVPELQIRPRSGLAAKFAVTLLNTPGTIDADYRGPIKVNLINHGPNPFRIRKGDRIAQGVCALVVQLPNIPVGTEVRGEGGFGSTGSR